jgi:hypothetical protein
MQDDAIRTIKVIRWMNYYDTQDRPPPPTNKELSLNRRDRHHLTSPTARRPGATQGIMYPDRQPCHTLKSHNCLLSLRQPLP